MRRHAHVVRVNEEGVIMLGGVGRTIRFQSTMEFCREN
jgi:hypothetical protein